MTTRTPWFSRRSAPVRAACSDEASTRANCTGRPPIPPSLLTSLRATSMPFMIGWPSCAFGPLSGRITPTVTGPRRACSPVPELQPAATSAKAARTAIVNVRFLVERRMALSFPVLHAAVGAPQVLVGDDTRGRGGGDRAAMLEHVRAVDDLQRLFDVLLDEQHGGAGPPDLPDGGEDLRDDLGGKPERRLVEQQQRRTAHERATQSAHLLLPAAQGAAALPAALRKSGKQPVHLVEPPGSVGPRAAAQGPELEVLLDGEVSEQVPGLGAVDDAALDQRVAAGFGDVLALEQDPPASGPYDAGDRHERGGLAGAVRAEQRNGFARVHVQADVEHGRHLAVAHRQALDVKQRSTPRRSRP